ncbi:MAG: SAM-dependent methyltransferase [Lachnospiraceae bacterium]|nr:SAM-dependent methyltransferase [Lachnospiraceae bacterium]
MGPVLLSERLRAVASMVTPGSRVCDVGCDHGFVSIWLVEQNVSPRVLAMDVRVGPLGAAGRHVAQRGLESLIETRLSDGLHNYEIGEADSLICAGMGGRLMMRILGEEKAKTDSFKELILQPQSEIMQFRTWLREQGLRITDEKMVEEDGKFYPMMRAVPEAGCLGVEDAEESRRSGEPGWQKPAADAERSGIQGMERVELCKLYDRYGGFLLQRGDSTLLAFLQKEERVYTEILDRLQGQGLDCDKRRMRYAEVETLLAECRRAKAIALRGAGCGS